MLVALGVFAVMAPMFTGVATAFLVGLLMVAGGIAETIFAFKAPSFGKGVLAFLFGGLTLVVGLYLVAAPDTGLGVLTFVLAFYFFGAGIVDLVIAFQLKPDDGWGWTLFSGIASILLGGFIIWQWPVSGLFAVGLYVGIRLLLHGWALMSLGVLGGDTLAAAQEQRLEVVESRVRAGIEALQETRVALAVHTAMILALDNELRKKVSSEEVDPAIRDLNTRLGEAREKMEQVKEASYEAWEAGQQEAERAFDSLQESVAEAAERLRSELGVKP
jgi:uncharacterized membrane protein HdeD (DUF308 family)